MPKVSVIVPVYNVEKYLKKCLDSLVNQTLKDIEIIVVNDGSPDNSQEIIDKYVKKYKNVKSYIKENGGLSSARNYGLKYAKGEYIAFVDSDDWVEVDMYEKMYKKAIKNHFDIVVCDTVEFYESGKTIYKKSNLKYSDNDIKNYIISPPMACTRLYKRKIFNDIKFEEKIFYEDLNLNPSLAIKITKVAFVEEGLYYYLQRTGSIMYQKEFSDKLLDIFKVLNNNYKNLKKIYPDEIEYLYITHLLRTATLRFLDYKDSKKELNKINRIMKDRFSNWRKNQYYKNSSFKLKLICYLASKKQYLILKILKNIK